MAELKRVTTPFSYSSAVEAGDYVFLGLHRGQGEDFAAQFDSTFRYLEKTLAQFDLKLADIVKINVWLKHIQDLPAMEKRFEIYFSQDHFPARMTATTQFIDQDCLIMVEGTAYRQARSG
jgi:2-iminobutanoate/2-iminopropanoate deaminase